MGVLDAAPRSPPREPQGTRARSRARLAAFERASAFKDVLDGTFGDPVAIARARWHPCCRRRRPSQRACCAPDAGAGDRCSPASRWTRRTAGWPRLWSTRRARSPAEHRFPTGSSPSRTSGDNWLQRRARRRLRRRDRQPALRPPGADPSASSRRSESATTFDGVADLYVYFYELGLRLLRPGGRLSFVVTNKWLRAGYAEELRGLLRASGWLEAVVDFGHAKKFFPDADVFPCVIVVRRPDGRRPAAEPRSARSRATWCGSTASPRMSGDQAFPLPRALHAAGLAARTARGRGAAWTRYAAPACR